MELKPHLTRVWPRPGKLPARALFAAGLALIAAACSDDAVPTAASPTGVVPQALISDAVHNGKPHFFFLAPVVQGNPGSTGEFDPLLAPRVEICTMTSTGCAGVIASWGPGSVALEPTNGGAYRVNWNTRNYELNENETYRIRVLVEDVELGFADVDLVSNGSQLRNVLTDEYIPLLDGTTLPIRFRVEAGFLGRITVTPNPASVVVTMSQQFSAVATDLHGNVISTAFTWSTGDQGIATVDANGLATGVADGIVPIYATASGAVGSAMLDVIGVARVDVAPNEVLGSPGGTQQLVATLYDSDDNVITGPPIVWASSDDEVVTVDQAGLASMVAAGVATVSATAAGVTGSADVEVVNVARIDVQPAAAEANQGRTQQFAATLYDVYDQVVTYPVTWASVNEEVPTVDQSGLATGIAGGIANITATSEGVVGAAIFEVIGVDRIEVVPAEAEVAPEESQQFEAILYDRDDNVLTGFEVVWSSADETIATVDQTGLATGVAQGRTDIVARSFGVTGSASLSVVGGTRIEVRPLEASATPGNTQQFEAIQYDANDNVITGLPVTWSTSDQAIATVDQNGLATAVAFGVATITATAGDASGSATLSVIGRTVTMMLPSGAIESIATDVNDSGLMVGNIRFQSGFPPLRRAFRWDGVSESSMQVLPMGTANQCEAWGVTNTGTIVGWCSYPGVSGAKGVYWTAAGLGPNQLPTPTSVLTHSRAHDITEGPGGVIITGTLNVSIPCTPGGPPLCAGNRAAKWTGPSVETVGPATVIANHNYAISPLAAGWAVASNGHIAGQMTRIVQYVDPQPPHPFRLTDVLSPFRYNGTGSVILPRLFWRCNPFGSDCSEGAGLGINTASVVVGWVDQQYDNATNAKRHRAAVWVPGGTLGHVPGLPQATVMASEAHDINEAGWIVGWAGTNAFLSRNGGAAETLEPFTPNTTTRAFAVSQNDGGVVYVAGSAIRAIGGVNRTVAHRWTIIP